MMIRSLTTLAPLFYVALLFSGGCSAPPDIQPTTPAPEEAETAVSTEVRCDPASFDPEQCSPSGWCPVPVGEEFGHSHFRSSWVESSQFSVWVGTHGALQHFDGTRWYAPNYRGELAERVENGLDAASLLDVWGSSANDVWAVGREGSILHFDGLAWEQRRTGSGDILAVHGSGPNNVWAVGEQGDLFHFDGQSWMRVPMRLPGAPLDLWVANRDNLFVLTRSGVLQRRSGDMLVYPIQGNALWGSSAEDVYVVGDAGALFHFDGTTWVQQERATLEDLHAVWGSGPNDVYVAGPGGVQHFDGSSWTDLEIRLPFEATTFALGGSRDVVFFYDGSRLSFRSDCTSSLMASHRRDEEQHREGRLSWPWRCRARDLGRNVYEHLQISATSHDTLVVALDFGPGWEPATRSFPHPVFSSAGESDVLLFETNRENEILWINQLDGSGADVVTGVAIGPDDSIVFTGTFTESIDLDPGPNCDSRTSHDQSDAFVVSLDPAGQWQWSQVVAGERAVRSHDVAISSDSEVTIVGSIQGEVETGSPELRQIARTAGSRDAFIARFDGDGAPLWLRTIGGEGLDYCSAVASTSDGGVVVVGAYENSVDFDPGNGIERHRAVGGRDVFVLRLDGQGQLAWVRTYGGPEHDWATSVAVGADDSVALVGGFSSPFSFTSRQGETLTAPQALGPPAFLIRLGSDGRSLWAHSLGCGENWDRLLALTLTSTGEAIVGGSFFNCTAHLPGSEGLQFPFQRQTSDAYLLAYAREGEHLWTHRMGGLGRDAVSSIAVRPNDSILAAGWFNGTADLDPGPAIDAHSGPDDQFARNAFLVELRQTRSASE